MTPLAIALVTVVVNAGISQLIAWRQARASYQRGYRAGRLASAVRSQRDRADP